MSHIYFFSENCKFSIEAYEHIKKIGVSKFKFVNIDDKHHTLPPEIDRVPAIISKDKELLFEQQLFDFLYKLMDVEPFMINEMGKLSDKYSYMDSSVIDHSYQFLNKNTAIMTPTEEENRKIINYEQYLQERDNDLKVFTE